MTQPGYTILLFYKYVHIDDPEIIHDNQKKICNLLGLKGRIIIAKEGINATVEGTHDSTEKYIQYMKTDERFSDIVFKKSEGTGSAFPKLSVKVRPEIVSLQLNENDIDPNECTGNFLPAKKLHEWFRKNKDFHVVDMRNDYEHKIGHFKDSRLLSMKNFRDLKNSVDEISDLKDKTVVAVCTGGIRCEKATGFLKQFGFSDVYQLEDGIVTYMEKYPNKDYLGKLYVFDSRVAMGFETDSPEHVILTNCTYCGDSCDTYRDCAEQSCYPQYICCDTCYESEKGKNCSIRCKGLSCLPSFFRSYVRSIIN